MRRLVQLEVLFCGIAIALGVFLRVFRFWAPSLWLDELGTAHVASAPDWATLVARCRFEYHPPLHYIVAKAFLWLGHSELFLRLPSVAFGLGSLALLIVLVTRVAGRRGGLYAGAIWALNSRAIMHSQDGRMYAQALFLTLASVYLLIQVLEGAGRLHLLRYALATLAAGYTHIIFTAVLATEIVAVLVCRHWSPERPGDLRPLLGLQGLVLLLFTPLLPLVRAVAGGRQTLYGWIERPDLAWFLDFLRWPEVAFAAVLAPGLLLAWKKRRAARPQTTSHVVLASFGLVNLSIWPVAVLLALAGSVNLLQPRYLLLPLVGLLLLTGFCVAKLDEPLLRLGLCVYLALGAYFQIRVAREFGPWAGILTKQDWRAANAFLHDRYRPGDVVLLRAGLTPVRAIAADEPGVQSFLASPLAGFYSQGPLKIFNLPWYATELPTSTYTPAAVRDEARAAGRVFVLVNPLREPWNWEALESWLGPRNLLEKRSFQGLQLRVYRP